MKNVLLTGATGYIGSNIARTLLCEGYEVHIIARPFSGFDLLADIKNNVKIHIYNSEPEKLNDIFKEIHPDILIHLASIYVAEHQAKDIGSLVNSNILFGTEVLNAAISCGVNYFINTGSYWQNYNGDAYNPVNLYAATKQAFECIMKYYREVSKLRSVTIKLVDTYGPYDPRPKVMTLLKKAVQSGAKLEMSPGDQDVGFVYIDDVVKGYLLAIKAVEELEPHMHKSFIIAPGEYCKLRDVVAVFEEVYGNKLNIDWGKRDYRRREILSIDLNEPNIISGQRLISLFDGIKMVRNIEEK